MRDYFNIKLPDDEVAAMSMLALAHIGDAVYELMVRTYLGCSGKATARGLHRAAVALVCAPAQARAAARIHPLLSDGEVALRHLAFIDLHPAHAPGALAGRRALVNGSKRHRPPPP